MEWIKVKDRLPKGDRRLLLYVKNNLHPHWTGEKIGSYDGKFYAEGGIDTSCEEVTHWMLLPDRPKV